VDSVVREHEALIREAIELGASARRRGDHPFGALLAIDGRVVLRAENTVITDRDPTRHAELNLLQLAWRELDESQIAAATLYASTEPCPMCAAAVHYSRISRLVFSFSQSALTELTGGSFALPSSFLLGRGTHRTVVVGPVLPDEGRSIHEGFWR
jgi:tRNA(Arg) A34 adenosine deaminase TadA